MQSSRRLVVTPEAAADVRSILRYTRATWDEAQRQTYAATLDAAFARLVEFPGIGKRRDELAAGLRSHPVGGHVIYYRVSDEAVVIRRIIHRRRDVADELGL